MFERGKSGNPNGRPKGALNKDTREFRVALNNLLERSAPKMLQWLDRVADEDPARALDLVGRLAEYIYPKLARTEISGQDGGSITFETFLLNLDGKGDDDDSRNNL